MIFAVDCAGEIGFGSRWLVGERLNLSINADLCAADRRALDSRLHASRLCLYALGALVTSTESFLKLYSSAKQGHGKLVIADIFDRRTPQRKRLISRDERHSLDLESGSPFKRGASLAKQQQ